MMMISIGIIDHPALHDVYWSTPVGAALGLRGSGAEQIGCQSSAYSCWLDTRYKTLTHARTDATPLKFNQISFWLVVVFFLPRESVIINTRIVWLDWWQRHSFINCYCSKPGIGGGEHKLLHWLRVDQKSWFIYFLSPWRGIILMTHWLGRSASDLTGDRWDTIWFSGTMLQPAGETPEQHTCLRGCHVHLDSVQPVTHSLYVCKHISPRFSRIGPRRFGPHVCMPRKSNLFRGCVALNVPQSLEAETLIQSQC